MKSKQESVQGAYPEEFLDTAVLKDGNVTESLTRAVNPPIVQQLTVSVGVHDRYLAWGRVKTCPKHN